MTVKNVLDSATTVGVIGAGAWGTALANVAARTGRSVALWARRAEQVAELTNLRENRRYLADIRLADTVAPTADLARAADNDLVLLVVPAQSLRSVAAELRVHVRGGATLISCAKGIERDTLMLPTQVLAEEIPEGRPAVLSGPSFASDVASGLPTAVTVAASSLEHARCIGAALASATFRIYHSDDVAGVEIGGAAKNVMAIAAGIAAGRGLGASAGAALVARSFAELRRLGKAFGARPETLMGLSGLGDLILTAGSPQSRNFALGHAIGSGLPLPDVLAEGAFTARGLLALAAQHNVDMPIASAVEAVLSGRASPDHAVELLLDRPLRAEN
ncbi:glycerol-3-phosphate dehydrogenase [NAD(P)+] [Agaricicola taiwanensis]|uniref:Glycerol-3-phosphate dehydrogenase [NAD(P)+] n=1 Tax=Agaricicola taiwanensis TaxID=591372 RepID=A0A8J2VKA3_9RHOB|nr:NAD(P)H-dependent glycerol-3-phosphate dehydrogenase [Agaricicola taiwanensis]GGE27795.1 glycerol-3-phosphate dehydrogenase [NAD(P)+] [Agaricicola taiwanensis]